ncbi:MAG: TetR/AcrR family transcriptional regulator, partial [Alphaproteobacteria bacterium]
GTNVRQIASAADVPLSLVSYHFPTKLELYEAVIARRADELSAVRIDALEAARAAKGAALDIRDVLGAYAVPFIDRSAHRSAGWRNYCQLIARVGTSRRWQPVVGKYFDATSEIFIAEIEALYPNSPPED